MPQIDPLHPATFSVVRTTPAGYPSFMRTNYRYLVSVVPTDPTQYQGPEYVSVSTDTLMTENQVLAAASDMALSRSLYGLGNTSLDLTIVDAFINPELLDSVAFEK